jgi:hypothetical protein
VQGIVDARPLHAAFRRLPRLRPPHVFSDSGDVRPPRASPSPPATPG